MSIIVHVLPRLRAQSTPFLATESAGPSIKSISNALDALEEPITRFFDDVLVMSDDEKQKRSRLGLVQHIAALPDGVADLSRLEGF